MKNTAIFIKNKVALLGAVGLAAIVGGLTVGLVSASIPDSVGTVHGCYRNNAGLTVPKGNLRVIDTGASETCTNQETALNWSQNSGQIISNRIEVAFGGASNQQVITIPNLGVYRVNACDSEGGSDGVYANNTGHDVELDGAVVANGQSTGINLQGTLLSYKSGVVNYIATLRGISSFNADLEKCYFVAQATLSQN